MLIRRCPQTRARRIVDDDDACHRTLHTADSLHRAPRISQARDARRPIRQMPANPCCCWVSWDRRVTGSARDAVSLHAPTRMRAVFGTTPRHADTTRAAMVNRRGRTAPGRPAKKSEKNLRRRPRQGPNSANGDDPPRDAGDRQHYGRRVASSHPHRSTSFDSPPSSPHLRERGGDVRHAPQCTHPARNRRRRK